MRQLPDQLACVVAACAFAVATPSQSAPLRTVVEFGVEAGLPAGRVLGLAPSSSGLWAATASGAAWFDDYEWHTVPLGNVHGVRGIASRASDPHVFVWGAHWILRVDRDGVVQEALGDEILQAGIAGLAVVSDGLLVLLDEGNSSDVRLLKGGASRSSGLLGGGDWLHGTVGGGAVAVGRDGTARWGDGGWSSAGPALANASRVCWSRDNRVIAMYGSVKACWVVQWGDAGGPLPPEQPSTQPVRAVAMSPSGQGALVDAIGRVFLATDDRQWELVGQLRGSFAEVCELVLEEDGRLWAATAGGVASLAPRRASWKSTPPDSPTWIGVLDMAEDADGTVWWTTRSGLVRGGECVKSITVDGRRWSTRGFAGIVRDVEGRMWISAGRHMGGVVCHADGAWTWHHTTRDGERLRGIDRVALDGSGRPWLLGASRAEVFRFDEEGGVVRWAPASDLGAPAAEMVDDGEHLAFALPQFGVRRYHRRREEWIDTELPGGARSLAWDAAHSRLWFVGSEGSIGWIEGGAVVRPNALQRISARAVAAGPDGQVWMVGHEGLSSFDGLEVHLHRAPGNFALGGSWSPQRGGKLLADVDRVVLASDGGIATYFFAPPPAQPLRITMGEVDGGIGWRVQPHRDLVGELLVRHRFDDGPWTVWGRARHGVLATAGLDRGEHALELEVSVPLGGAIRDSLRFEVPRNWGPWITGGVAAGVMALLGLFLAWRLRRRTVELRSSRHLYRELVDGADDLICVLDLGMVVRTCNPAATSMLGLHPTALDGVAFPMLLADSASGEFGEHFARCARNAETEVFRSALRRKDGSQCPAEVLLSPLVRGGKVLGVRCVVRDLTARDRVEARRLESYKMAALGQMAGGIAHDFNNLLQIIHGYSETLVHKASGDLRVVAQEVHDASQRGAELVRELALFSRRDRELPAASDLNEMVAGLRSDIEQLVGSRVQVEFALCRQPLMVRLRRSDTHRILLNLVANARDAMPDGGALRIVTELAGADDLARLDGASAGAADVQGAVLRVTDTGVGMDEATRLQVFDPFYTTKSLGRGTGLGLSIVYGIVKTACGAIGVASELGAGTEVSLVLPREASAAAGGLSGHVLLVDDDDGVRREMARSLSGQGLHVLEARDVAEALVASETSARIDVIVSDLLQSERAGIDVVERVRQRHPDASALFLADCDRSELIRRGIRIEPERIVRRPVTGEGLAARLAAMLPPGQD